jgi:hypothetical protein
MPSWAPTIVYSPFKRRGYSFTVVNINRYGRLLELASLVTLRPTTVLAKRTSGGLCARILQLVSPCPLPSS